MQVPATITLNNDEANNTNNSNRMPMYTDMKSSYPMDIPEKLTGIELDLISKCMRIFLLMN